MNTKLLPKCWREDWPSCEEYKTESESDGEDGKEPFDIEPLQ